MSFSQRNGSHIPQAILDHYTAHYRNATYRAFGDALADGLPHGQADPAYGDVMNLLIDAAFERSGAELYRGSCEQLGMALVSFQRPELFALAEQHLRKFNSLADETVLTAGLLYTVETLRILAESGVRAAGDHHGWQGRAVFWWLGAIAQLAQAAHAILSQTQRSYVQEKLVTAIRHLRNGVSESAAVGYILADQLMNWLSRFPLD